jgi:excisionase family DNA binding protein
MTESPELEKHYTCNQVGEMFEVNPYTVRAWIKDKKLRAIRLPGGEYRIPESAIRELAEQKYGD